MRHLTLPLIILQSLLVVLSQFGSIQRTEATPKSSPLKVGILLPLTGDFSFFGEQAKRGIELALADLRKSGEDIEVVYEDERCLPKDALTAFKKLTTVDQVDYILGPACTGSIVSVGTAAQKAKKYMLALLDTNRPVAALGPFTYALGYSSEEEAELVAEHMYAKGTRKVGVIVEDDAWAVNVKDAFVSRFKTLGGTITSEESQLITNASSAPDYKGIIVKTVQRRPDALFVVPAYNGGYFLKQLRAMGQKIPVFGPDTFAVTEVVEIAGEHANGVVCANALVDESSPAANILRAELTRLLGTSPTSIFYSALGYDGLKALVKAARSDKPFPDAMSTINYDTGVLPIPSFDADRLAKLKPGLFKIESGKIVPLTD